jgi:hypothetical protein
MCAHEGNHTGVGHYDTDRRELRWVIECDACGTELVDVAREPYTPAFIPHPPPVRPPEPATAPRP